MTTDTFNYMTKHPYTSILTAAVSATAGTALVVQALEIVGIAAGVVAMTGVAATLSIAGIMAIMGIQKAADKLAKKIMEYCHVCRHEKNAHTQMFRVSCIQKAYHTLSQHQHQPYLL